ncbi:MAG: dihydroorotate dehydrogenase-like protein [Vicinamibacteria bacterium]|nr:dihydroorotate dehydrogenase-like protein [Vicinamibacteria bacterium]
MNLSTRYLGLDLPHPLIAGASPLADHINTVRELEDAGAAAIVLRSLFEEQITREQTSAFLNTEPHNESSAEALTYFPARQSFAFGPEEYLNHLARVKAAVNIPVIASLNGSTPGGWLDYAPLIESAGADALELNVYRLAFDPSLSSQDVEREAVDIVREVRRTVRLPLSVKLSPFYSSLAHFAGELEQAGASGLVLFNRFYQPDIDPEALELNRGLSLSDQRELPLRLRWLGALSSQVKASLAVSGGIHDSRDAIKAVMAGAHAVQVVSALLEKGPGHLSVLRQGMIDWMREFEWESLDSMRGNMNLKRCPNPAAYERANYVQMLQGWRNR